MGKVNKKEFRELLSLRKRFPYSYEELESFYRAAYGAYRSLRNRKGVILAPLRGAEPFVKALHLFASLEASSSSLARVYFPRTGQQTRENSIRVVRLTQNYARAMDRDEKKEELSRLVDQAISLNGKNGRGAPADIFVLDEVDKGGSLSGTIRLLNEIAASKGRPVRIKGIAIAQEAAERMPEYQRLLSHKIVTEFPVKRLFTMDSPRFLRPLVETIQQRKATEGRARINYALQMRPRVGTSSEALHSNLELLSDLAELHLGKNRQTSRRLRRLPVSIREIG